MRCCRQRDTANIDQSTNESGLMTLRNSEGTKIAQFQDALSLCWLMNENSRCCDMCLKRHPQKEDSDFDAKTRNPTDVFQVKIPTNSIDSIFAWLKLEPPKTRDDQSQPQHQSSQLDINSSGQDNAATDDQIGREPNQTGLP